MIGIPLKDREFALYHGDKFVMIGSCQEIMDRIHIGLKTFKWYKTPSYVNNPKRKKGYVILDFYELDNTR